MLGDHAFLFVTQPAKKAQPFPSGTVMLFQQTTAPIFWTKQTTHNDKALRVVSGSAGPPPLATLRDAALYVTKLPKAELAPQEWQAARLFLEYDSRFEFEAETAAGIVRPMEAARHASGRGRI
jgi:hypothetical protein